MKNKLTGLFVVLFILGVFLGPLDAKALTISPPSSDYSLNPGDKVSDVIKLYNEAPYEMTVYPIAVNFMAGDDEQGAPQFYYENDENGSYGLAQWLSFDHSPITIPSGGRENLFYTITVPADGEPGGHFGGIIMSSDPPEAKGGSVGLGAQIASIMLLRVSGDVIEQGYIEEFGFLNRKRIYSHLPVNFFVRFKNEGTTHLRPAGNAFIKNMLGLPSTSIEVNSAFGSVLPDSVRKYSFYWKKSGVNESSSELMKELKNFGFGRYKATVVLNYGKDNKIATAERTFWVLPWMLIIIGLIVLVILGFMLKLYNRSVVKSYERKRTRNG